MNTYFTEMKIKFKSIGEMHQFIDEHLNPIDNYVADDESLTLLVTLEDRSQMDNSIKHVERFGTSIETASVNILKYDEREGKLTNNKTIKIK